VKENTFATPDFAYPQTVIENATVAFQRAKSGGNELDLIKAAIQLTVAEDNISTSNMPRMAAMLDTAAGDCKGAAQAILYMLEAKLYNEVYVSDRGRFSGRNLPLDSFPADPQLWSADMFALKIEGLVRASLASVPDPASCPVTEWKELFSGLDGISAPFYPTLYSVLAPIGTRLLSPLSSGKRPIPFSSAGDYKSPSQRVSASAAYITAQNAALAMQSGDVAWMAVALPPSIEEQDPQVQFRKLVDLYGLHSGSPYAAELLVSADRISNLEPADRAELAALMRKAIAAHPTYVRVNALKAALQSVDSKNITLKVAGQILPDKEFDIEIEQSAMVHGLHVQIFKIPAHVTNVRDALKKGICTRVASYPVTQDTCRLTASPLRPGYYCLVPVQGAGGSVTSIGGAYISPVTLRVSGMQALYSSSRDGSDRKLYIVSAIDGSPLSGVKVMFTSKAYGKPEVKISAVTDADGAVIPPDRKGANRNLEFTATRGSDTFSGNLYQYAYSSPAAAERVQIFTSLGLYKPGTKCDFAIVSYLEGEGVCRIEPGSAVTVQLFNASGVKVDSVDLVTDEQGRAQGSFMLPEQGMLGSFSLRAVKNDKSIGYAMLQVEEYRQPGFYVELNSDQKYYSLGETINLSGQVVSYSGMPLAGSSVEINIEYSRPWWRYWGGPDGSYAATVSAGADGRFTLALPTGNLRDTPFAQGVFKAEASVTSPAGETQRSESVMLSLGARAKIVINVPSILKIDSDTLNLKVRAEGTAVSPVLGFRLKSADADVVAAGEVSDGKILVTSSAVPSGAYSLEVYDIADPKNTEKAEFTVYRDSDKCPPVKRALWVPETILETTSGSRSVNMRVGTSYDNQHIICIISDSHKIISKQILTLSCTDSIISVPVPDKSVNTVYLFAVRDGAVSDATVRVSAPKKEIVMKAISFRDRINAGGKERWIFRYEGINTTASIMPVIATLSDHALNAIKPFDWQWYRDTPYYMGMSNDTFGRSTSSGYYSINNGKRLSVPALMTPELFTYSYSLYGRAVYGIYEEAEVMPMMSAGVRVRTSAKMAANATSDMALNEEIALDEGGEEFSTDSAETGSDTARFRPAEMPLAWFRPMLSTDESGDLEIAFDAPDFNTTWRLQMMAYNEDLVINKSVLTTVATKPVMVKPSAPRFLRTGDRAVIPAAVFNNTDAEAYLSATVVLYDPLTGEKIAQREYAAEEVPSMGSRIVTLEFDVPGDVQFVGYRIMGMSGDYTDGEQSLIRILPSSSPVTETYPFYLSPDMKRYSTKLPMFETTAMVELQFCDNPVWYCVTALPSLIHSSDASVMSLANTLYGTVISRGLVRQYPQIPAAIGKWMDQADSTLVSPLERNPELKTVALTSTPWLLNATSETLRMQQLSELADSTACDAIISATVTDLLKRHTDGGGWSWCEGMEPSAFITGQVLWRVGMLHHMGYSDLISPLDEACSQAMKYLDNEMCREVARVQEYPLSSLLDWLYIHSFFPSLKMSGAAEGIKAKAIKKLVTEWKNMDIYHAATAAILLMREGYTMQAKEILVSLRQRASADEARGMWYDNLRTGFYGHGTLVTTAQVLEAFAEIDPSSPCVDKLRQWLVLERQAQDWGADAQLAEVVWSVLSCGSGWTDPSSPAIVTLGGEKLEVTHADALTGAFNIMLDPVKASGAIIEIARSGAGPAWGGVAARYIAPITDVQAFSESDVTIAKRLLLVSDDATGSHTSDADGVTLQAGDKVKVQLIVTSDRDIDYAVITDEQSGCLAPADQLSGYKYGGETGYYREVRTGVTNLFLPRLPKGKFILEYECFVEGDGIYSSGIATVQSLYAPMLSAHSAGSVVKVSAGN